MMHQALQMAAAVAMVTTPQAANAATANAGTDVPVGHFRSVELEEGGQVTLRHGAQQRVTLVQGDLAVSSIAIDDEGKLRIRTCRHHCPVNYRLEVEIVSPDVNGVAVSEGGSITAVGSFPQRDLVNVAVNEGGSVDVRAMTGDIVNAAVNEGGRIRTSAKTSLNAAIHEGGSITYWGNPIVNRAIVDGGSVQRATD
jgi:hypothetical protein